MKVEVVAVVGALMMQSVGRSRAADPAPAPPALRTGPGRRWGAVVWTPRLVTGLAAREAPVLSTFTPSSAGDLIGPPWLRRRRLAAAEEFASAPLPSEKDEVWRYSRIDQLELDRFRPAGTGSAGPADGPGPSPSDRVRSLV